MAATTTAFKSLLARLRNDFTQLSFRVGDDFRWSPGSHTVWYEKGSDDVITLLHETAHGLLGHATYASDVELLQLERAAWSKASELGTDYGYPVSEEEVERALDTYREWLHARSLCPNCNQNGIQQSDHRYLCVVCGQQWKVNDARHSGLRRHKLI